MNKLKIVQNRDRTRDLRVGVDVCVCTGIGASAIESVGRESGAAADVGVVADDGGMPRSSVSTEPGGVSCGSSSV